ncbi:MAG: hypothetical protein UU32_C0036G0003 [Candidatus Woesebacteria bacterium GW2011_GWB1_41_10]|uniref:Uncharacterized protein n=1 Tax=Candidatus Woesebacteria bacterium GW2011_GWB1_41_10 TaxID=1618577 RepID=A0A0G0XBR1_9BACT|nr:MAG: hypothetical protein UU32_C0036G0003 [Candidatus Woesebacteria bacterium GW2011_GWB1_41_10]
MSRIAFCPATYPTCAGKINSFDTLLMNKNKTYFNSDNNVYSNNPGAIFGGGYIRFVSAVSQWGRDTGIDGMISNYPLLVFNSNVAFGGDDDPKNGSKGARSFVANNGGSTALWSGGYKVGPGRDLPNVILFVKK